MKVTSGLLCLSLSTLTALAPAAQAAAADYPGEPADGKPPGSLPPPPFGTPSVSSSSSYSYVMSTSPSATPRMRTSTTVWDSSSSGYGKPTSTYSSPWQKPTNALPPPPDAKWGGPSSSGGQSYKHPSGYSTTSDSATSTREWPAKPTDGHPPGPPPPDAKWPGKPDSSSAYSHSYGYSSSSTSWPAKATDGHSGPDARGPGEQGGSGQQQKWPQGGAGSPPYDHPDWHPDHPSQVLWGQCGGYYYHGPTKCPPGAYCRYFSDWYSQCNQNGS